MSSFCSLPPSFLFSHFLPGGAFVIVCHSLSVVRIFSHCYDTACTRMIPWYGLVRWCAAARCSIHAAQGRTRLYYHMRGKKASRSPRLAFALPRRSSGICYNMTDTHRARRTRRKSSGCELIFLQGLVISNCVVHISDETTPAEGSSEMLLCLPVRAARVLENGARIASLHAI